MVSVRKIQIGGSDPERSVAVTDPHQKARLARVLLLAAAVTVSLAGYVAIFASTGRGFPCILYALTGWQCGGCGLTRAAASLLELDVASAFSFHALWPVPAAYLVWVGVSDATVYVRTGKVQLLQPPWWIHGAALAVTVGYGILRNLL